MRIGIWLDDDYKPEEGGGHSYYDKLIKAINNYEFDPRLKISFISAKGHNHLSKPVVVIGALSRTQVWTRKIIKLILSTKLKSKITQFAFKEKYRKLQEAKIDVIYYPIQAQQVIPDYPFIATNWDIGHLSTFPFPEFTAKGEFEARERWYKQYMIQALLIFAESEAGKKELIRHLNIAPDRIKVVPLFAGNITSADSAAQASILQKFNIQPGRFFFYPAQFWPHKNHFALLNAFKNITSSHPDLRLVFTGSDKGNVAYIKSLVKEYGLLEKVFFLGFVSSQELYTLYSNAAALVMPTFLGPTNMPLLEAWELNCPILCSDFEGHREMLKEAALYFPPSDEQALSRLLQQILDGKQKEQMLTRARQELPLSPFKVETAIIKIQQHLIDLIPVRGTWQ